MSDGALIGVSCGHRVPRAPKKIGGRRLYWCATCGAHRMSGGRSTGESGHDYLFALRDLVEIYGVVVDDPGNGAWPHGRRRARCAYAAERIVPAVSQYRMSEGVVYVLLEVSLHGLRDYLPGCDPEAVRARIEKAIRSDLGDLRFDSDLEVELIESAGADRL